MKCLIMRHFIWVYIVCQRTCLGVASIQHVKIRVGTNRDFSTTGVKNIAMSTYVIIVFSPGPIAQLVASPTADPGVASLIPVQSHIFIVK